MQSFKKGEVTPELALEIAKEFVEECLPEYEAVMGTHVDKEHIHSHIIINSVNAVTGKKYHSNAKSYYRQIRAVSDRLCRKHGLSVIITGEDSQSVSYIEWLRQSRGQPTFRSMLEADLRRAIEDADSLGEFFMIMENLGYDIRVLNLVNLSESDGYNPFRYLRDEKDALRLVNNLIQSTTPKNSQSNDPFWEKAETALLQAIILMLFQEAPEYEQNFVSVGCRGGLTRKIPGSK